MNRKMRRKMSFMIAAGIVFCMLVTGLIGSVGIGKAYTNSTATISVYQSMSGYSGNAIYGKITTIAGQTILPNLVGVLSKKGYSTVWVNAKNGVVITSSTVLNGNISVYPLYKENTAFYTFCYNDTFANRRETIRKISVSTGKTIKSVIKNPELNNYRFLGWSTSRDGSTGVISTTTAVTITGDRTLYAQWDKIKGDVKGEEKVAYQVYTKNEVYSLWKSWESTYKSNKSVSLQDIFDGRDFFKDVKTIVTRSATSVFSAYSTFYEMAKYVGGINERMMTSKKAEKNMNYYKEIYNYMNTNGYNSVILCSIFYWACMTDNEGCDYYEWRFLCPDSTNPIASRNKWIGRYIK